MKNIILIYFSMKNTLKSNHNHIPKLALNLLAYKVINLLDKQVLKTLWAWLNCISIVSLIIYDEWFVPF